MDMKEKKMTVIGTVDPIDVVSKLRKTWQSADIVAVGPAKEEKKDGKKDEKKDGKKEEKKDEKKEEKKDDKKKEEKEKEKEKDPDQQMQMMHDFVYAYNRGYPQPQPQMNNQHYFVRSMEENPNACVIC